jgi:cell division protein FtsZ
MEDTYKFELPKHHKSIIKVIGVGGGGSNAVNHMYNQGIKDVEFVVVNTDMQALRGSPVPNKVQIGTSLTEGLGAGANPDKGKQAALESKEEIRDMLSDDTKMVFITAGMGGGTGTGAAPVIAKIAKDMEILTVGIVTAPFSFEGRKKIQQAYNGIRELRESCDTVLVILNDKLREIYGNLSITTAFSQADNILLTAAKGIAEIITVIGYVNVDFEDVKTVMKDAGAAVMGSATAEGEGRALRAAQEAITSPLLNSVDIHGAQKILLSIISGDQDELQMDELTEISEYIQSRAGDEAEVIFGNGIDPSLGRSIRVTVIATGCDQQEPKTREEAGTSVFDLESGQKKKTQISLFPESKPEPKAEPKQAAAMPRPAMPTKVERPVHVPFTTQSKPVEVKPEQPVSTQKTDNVFDGLGEDYEIISNPKPSAEPVNQPPVTRNHHSDTGSIDDKRRALVEKSKERIRRLQGLKSGTMNQDEYKEKLEVPAYMRKKVPLSDVAPANEKNISRFQLNEESQIMGNNRFLHDNVD